MKSYFQRKIDKNKHLPCHISALMKALPDPIFQVDRDGRLLQFFTEGDEKVFRCEIDTDGHDLNDMFPASVAKQLQTALTNAMRDEEPQSVSYSMKIREKERSFEARIIPVVDRQGEHPKSAMVILRDITAEINSKEYFNLIKKIFEDTTEGMMIYSPRSNKVYFNNSFYRLFGLAREEKPGKRFEDLKNFFKPEQFEKILESIQSYDSYHGEASVVRPDGTQINVWINFDRIEKSEAGSEGVYEIAIFTDITQLDEFREELYFTATHDVLTGLPNRRLLMDHLEQAIQRCKRNRRFGALFFIDLDNFKQVNDTLGHNAGDMVLIECAKRIRSAIRKSDIFGRLGGDEFLLIVEEVKSSDNLLHLADKINKVISEPFYIEDLKYNISASIGIAIFPNDSDDKEELLEYADMAMYQAKEKGKNRYQFYSDILDRKIKRHYQIENILRDSLENDGFYLVYQPKIDLDTNRLTGLEALIRIDEKIAGSLPPQEFIPIAEGSNLIIEIGRWVFRHCCETIYQWSRNYHLENIEISINLSPRQLMDKSLAEFVEKTLKTYEIDPSMIEFEIPETAFVHSQKVVEHTIEELQEIGCKISIDDFGMGFSSLTTFRRFKVNKLKIDKSFIDEISYNNFDQAIVKASVAMAQAMDLKTVAIGVETDDQKRALQLLGCKEMQGFHFSKPKKAMEILYLLLKKQSS